MDQFGGKKNDKNNLFYVHMDFLEFFPSILKFMDIKFGNIIISIPCSKFSESQSFSRQNML